MRKFLLKVIVFFIVSALLGCTQTNQKKIEFDEENLFEKKLKTSLIELDKNNIKEIDLTTLIDFEFDYMYIFTPYTKKEQINKIIGFNWKGSFDINHDFYTTIIFVKNNEVINEFIIKNNYAYLGYNKNGSKFKENDLKFIIINEKTDKNNKKYNKNVLYYLISKDKQKVGDYEFLKEYYK